MPSADISPDESHYKPTLTAVHLLSPSFSAPVLYACPEAISTNPRSRVRRLQEAAFFNARDSQSGGIQARFGRALLLSQGVGFFGSLPFSFTSQEVRDQLPNFIAQGTALGKLELWKHTVSNLIAQYGFNPCHAYVSPLNAVYREYPTHNAVAPVCEVHTDNFMKSAGRPQYLRHFEPSSQFMNQARSHFGNNFKFYVHPTDGSVAAQCTTTGQWFAATGRVVNSWFSLEDFVMPLGVHPFSIRENQVVTQNWVTSSSVLLHDSRQSHIFYVLLGQTRHECILFEQHNTKQIGWKTNANIHSAGLAHVAVPVVATEQHEGGKDQARHMTTNHASEHLDARKRFSVEIRAIMLDLKPVDSHTFDASHFKPM